MRELNFILPTLKQFILGESQITDAGCAALAAVRSTARRAACPREREALAALHCQRHGGQRRVCGIGKFESRRPLLIVCQAG